MRKWISRVRVAIQQVAQGLPHPVDLTEPVGCKISQVRHIRSALLYPINVIEQRLDFLEVMTSLIIVVAVEVAPVVISESDYPVNAVPGFSAQLTEVILPVLGRNSVFPRILFAGRHCAEKSHKIRRQQTVLKQVLPSSLEQLCPQDSAHYKGTRGPDRRRKDLIR